MNKNEPGNHDETLRKVLKEWRTDTVLPPRFQEAVWRRIECAERAPATSAPSVWPVFAHWVGTMLPKPALAASYVAVLLAVGVTAGWTQARGETTRLKNELGERYVRVLDPYQTPRQ